MIYLGLYTNLFFQRFFSGKMAKKPLCFRAGPNCQQTARTTVKGISEYTEGAKIMFLCILIC